MNEIDKPKPLPEDPASVIYNPPQVLKVVMGVLMSLTMILGVLALGTDDNEKAMIRDYVRSITDK